MPEPAQPLKPDSKLQQARQGLVNAVQAVSNKTGGNAKKFLEFASQYPVEDLRPSVQVPEAMKGLQAEMEKRGFHVVNVAPELKNSENEVIFNRGDGIKSNFFVFAELTDTHAIRAMWTDPLGPEETDPRMKKTGNKLSNSEVLVNRVFKIGYHDVWVKGLCDEICRAAEHKPANVKFWNPHCHWRTSISLDDGRASIQTILRNFMLWHIDIDPTGFHNHIADYFHAHVQKLEAPLNIMKVPGCEVMVQLVSYEPGRVDKFIADITAKLPASEIWLPDQMPRRNDWCGSYDPKLVEEIIARNEPAVAKYENATGDQISRILQNDGGPHILVYFSSLEFANRINAEVLCRNQNKYAPLPPRLELAELIALRDQHPNDMALIAAHTFSNPLNPLEKTSVFGLGDRLRIGQLTLAEYLEAARKMDGLAAWNPSIRNTVLKFDTGEGEGFAKMATSKWNASQRRKVAQTDWYGNDLNLADSLLMRDGFNKPGIYDGDTHDNLAVSYGKTSIDEIGYGQNRIFNFTGSTPADFIVALRGTPRAFSSEIFFDAGKDGHAHIVATRTHRSFWEKAKYFAKEAYVYGLLGAPKLIGDGLERAKKVTTFKEKWRAFWDITR